MNPSTLAELKTNVFDEFPRQNPKIKALFDRKIYTWAHELSKAYPWAFLRVWPLDISELTFPMNLATVTRIRNEWIAPGWLVTDANQGKYLLQAPIEYEEWDEANWWTNATINNLECFSDRIWYCKRFDEQGYFIKDLPILERDSAFSSKTETDTGIPNYFYLSMTEVGTYIHFHPVPDANYLFCIEFQQIKPPFYVDPTDGGVHNKFLTFAPRILELYSLIQVARYFDEPKMQENFERELYGSPPLGLKRAINQKTGLIGDLVNDSIKMTNQQNQDLKIFLSAKQAVGREQRPRRYRYNNRIGYY